MPIVPKRNVYAYGNAILVECSQCAERATVATQADVDAPTITLACSRCDFMREWQRPQHEIRVMVGWRWVGKEGFPALGLSAPTGYNGCPVCISVGMVPGSIEKLDGREIALRLWLQSPCEGETLWFLNGEHLTFVEKYVQLARKPRSASFQEKSRGVEEWVRQPKNKERVLECIQKIRIKM